MAKQNTYLLVFSFNSKTHVEYKGMNHQLRVHQHLSTRRLNRCDEAQDWSDFLPFSPLPCACREGARQISTSGAD
jgi:hypothetical protein